MTEKLEDLMPVWDAVQSIAKRFGGLSRGQHALAIALREQMVCAAADMTAICEEADAEVVEEQAKGDDKCGRGAIIGSRIAFGGTGKAAISRSVTTKTAAISTFSTCTFLLRKLKVCTPRCRCLTFSGLCLVVEPA